MSGNNTLAQGLWFQDQMVKNQGLIPIARAMLFASFMMDRVISEYIPAVLCDSFAQRLWETETDADAVQVLSELSDSLNRFIAQHNRA